MVESFDIGEIYMPRAENNTKTYENLLLAVSDKGLSINTARAGKEIFRENAITAEFLAPVKDRYEDLNNYSAVVRLVYGNHSFVFMGDAEVISEILKADVLKVGHHGSDTASSAAFINTVSPKYAVIEVGKDNSYHHPHYEAVNHLNEAGASIFRTDINGTVSFVSDKENLTIICEKE